MTRLQKKCFIASGGMHLFLALLLVFGSAFFVSHDKTTTLPPLRAVPTRLVDNALAGGGGNPNIAPSDDQQKGQTLVPQPAPPQNTPPQQRPIQPQKAEVKPKAEIKKPVKPAKEQTTQPKEAAKPKPDPNAKLDKTPPLELKPVTRPKTDKVKEQAEAEAREAAAAAMAATRRAAQEFSKSSDRLREGFSQGTKIEIGGPGGAAYADYAQFVKAVYEDAWTVTDDLTDEDSTAKVSITIAKSGRVISARIERFSGNSALDKSVRRALDKVTFVRPFPPEAADEQRTFVINFNLKAKRQLG